MSEKAEEKADKATDIIRDAAMTQGREDRWPTEEEQHKIDRAESNIRAAFERAEEAWLLDFIVNHSADEAADALGCPQSVGDSRMDEVCLPEREGWPCETAADEDRWDAHCGRDNSRAANCWKKLWLLEAAEALAELDKQAKEGEGHE